MPQAIKAFLVSVALLLTLMWLLGDEDNPFQIASSATSIAVLLIAFGLTFAWVKHEFFPDKDDD